MGTLRKIKRKNGIVYRAEIWVDGKRLSKSFPDEIDARIWMRDKEQSIRTGEPIGDEPAHGDMLFYEAMDRFIVESRVMVSRSQIKNYENSQKILERTFNPRTKMSEITRQEVSKHVLKRMTVDNVGPSSIRNELSFIRGVFVKAVEWGVDFPSPELSIKRPKARMKSREDRLDNVIKPDEITAIFTQAAKSRNNLYLYLKFLLYTGMRPSEAAQLYWERLPATEEKDAMKIRNPVGFVDLDRGGFSKVGTKTEKRFVPAHQKVIEVLGQLKKARAKDQQMVFLDNKYKNRDRPYRYYRKSMQTVLRNARIDDRELRGGIDFYSFRHTCRSNMARCRIITELAETIIGHNDRSFKFTYIHVDDETLIDAMNLLEYPVEI